jgi:hypothetical protein
MRRNYGMFWLNAKYQAAHRAAWQIYVGPIPESLWVLHKCDTPSCVNPQHLFLGTHSDNIRDAVNKGRMKCLFLNGEQHTQAKLTEAHVRKIRRSNKSQRQIASELGVGQTTVGHIRRRITWRHVT